jgi:hypothetical protein
MQAEENNGLYLFSYLENFLEKTAYLAVNLLLNLCAI